MVIYFTEEDLVSFGEYMVSPQRKQLLTDKPNPEGLSLDERLSMVHDGDLAYWAYLVNVNRQVADEINNEDKVIN
jgi:hypothetical protein